MLRPRLTLPISRGPRLIRTIKGRRAVALHYRVDRLYPPAARSHRPVLRLDAGQCRWPIGEPGTPGFRFCCAARRVGSSYCSHHHHVSRSGKAGATGEGRRVPGGSPQFIEAAE
ncbi:MAG: GcrA family cell cycle regulator [Beijerinckiaceae bacterium]|nr:GcrA family cell cycle regulator [Beijerinckiaceae bacterium]